MSGFSGIGRVRAAAAALVLGTAASGCGAVAALTEHLRPVGGTEEGRITGELSKVDPGEEVLGIRTPNGTPIIVGFDSRTRVVHRGRDHRPDELEVGDVVTLRVRATRHGDLFTELVEVREAARQPGGDHRLGIHRTEGRVEEVDLRRGRFVLAPGHDRPVTVSLPFDAGRPAVQRFQRLQAGQWVRIEGYRLGEDRLELAGFAWRARPTTRTADGEAQSAVGLPPR